MPDADASASDAVSTEDLGRLRALLTETVRDAGALALSLFGTTLKEWTKGASSPVSEADIAVNDLIEARLRANTPNYGWLSEESADDPARLAARRVWIIDPIDGTRTYLAHRDDWCVSAALVEDGQPLLAAVFAPVSDEFFVAERGSGASRNGVAIHASKGTVLDFPRIAGPKPIVEQLGLPPHGVAIHPRIGSLALRLCRIGDGTLDVAFAGGQSRDWDLAAADLIVHEADGRMTMLSGEPIGYNGPKVTHGVLMAAGRERHARVVEHFRGRSY